MTSPIDLGSAQARLILALILALAALALFVLVLLLGLSLGRRQGRLEAERGLPGLLARERGDAVKRSRAVIGGQTAEQLAPYFPDFPFDPGECRFIGKPVDFLVFRGAASGAVEEVVFVEVKSGASSLSKVERSLRDAVQGGKVRWAEYRAP
jgi:predicted Holliday junction resolvase-like endonuclease